MPLPHLESSGLDLDVTDDISFLDPTRHWTLSVPTVRFDLTQLKKPTQNTMYLINSPTSQLISEYASSHKIFTDVSKTADGIAVAAASSRFYRNLYACRLSGDRAIYTAELRAILLAQKHVYYSKEKSFPMILSYSFAALQGIYNVKFDHPVLIKIQKLYLQLLP